MFTTPDANDPNRQMAGTDDRRREPRYLSGSFGEVTNLNSMSAPHPAEVVDVSKSGVRFRSELDLQRGVRVKVSFGDTLAFGEVRWCSQLEAHWFETGVAIQNTLPKKLVSRIQDAAAGR
jgi:hypothetical protein